MKFINIGIVVLLTLATASNLDAQKLYTWTDENGNLHITDQPPPKSAEIEDVTTYRERTPQELERIQQEKEKQRRDLVKEDQVEKARQAEIEAREADQRAKEAVEQAQEVYEANREYIRRLSTNRDRRKQFRKRIQRLKN